VRRDGAIGHHRSRLSAVGERVLLLGAGASYGARLNLAGPPNGPPPPRGCELAQYMLRWLRANDPKRAPRTDPSFGQHYIGSPSCANWAGDELWEDEHLVELIRALTAVASSERAQPAGEATPFEILMADWTKAEDGYRLFGPAHRSLAYSMNYGYRCAFVECPDRLDLLLAQEKPTIVVTVKYDTLTEEALRRRGYRTSHPGLTGIGGVEQVSNGNGPIVPVFKLHGSVNWVPVHGVGASATEEVAARTAAERPTDIAENGPYTAAVTFATSAVFDRPSLLHDLEDGDAPVVAVYGAGKYVIDNFRHVEGHRKACRDRLGSDSIDCVVAVGIRPVSGRRRSGPASGDRVAGLSRRARGVCQPGRRRV
jgi:hypothetical protein